jgi:hypothetical protein
LLMTLCWFHLLAGASHQQQLAGSIQRHQHLVWRGPAHHTIRNGHQWTQLAAATHRHRYERSRHLNFVRLSCNCAALAAVAVLQLPWRFMLHEDHHHLHLNTHSSHSINAIGFAPHWRLGLCGIFVRLASQ